METKRELTTLAKNEAENVLAWLNDELPKNSYTKAGRRRLLELIDNTKRLADLTNEVRQQGLESRRWPKELISYAVLVNEQIKKYPSWPIVMWSPKGNLEFGEDFSVIPNLEDEAATAHCILGLAKANVLNDIRQCACKRWFFARGKNQKSCSATCRHKLYEKTDAFKAKRREYMKQYSRLKRSGKVK